MSTYFILAVSEDNGVTWTDRHDRRYENGAEAAAWCKSENKYNAENTWSYARNTRWRVRKIVPTDSDNFYEREAAKNLTPFDFHEKYDLRENYVQVWQLAHYHPEDKTKVRFFRRIEDAIECRYTVMSVSRFIDGHYYADHKQVEEFLCEIGYYSKDATFEILTDKDDIIAAYENGPTSCMNDPDEYELPQPHPSIVYSGPDFALAVIKRGAMITARTVICPERKIFAECYGHCALLVSELESRGYVCKTGYKDWKGLRLLKVYNEDDNFPIMPYLDISEYVVEDGDYLVTNGSDGGLFAKNTHGYLTEEY